MTDFITQMYYDQGIYDAVENEHPVFSKPIWTHLIHETKTVDDRTRILTSKSFNPATNPNIIPGIYTRPCVWVEQDDMPQNDRLIRFVTRQTRFAHSGANRPMDGLRGIASVWWNRLYCHALNEVGVPAQPTLRADDWPWFEKLKKPIEHALKEKRVPLIQALTQRIIASNIDVLGQGGEFIVLNQSVIDWEATRAASGFESAHKRRHNVLKGMLETIYEEVRALIMEMRETGDKMAYAQIKPIASAKVVILDKIMMSPDRRDDFFARMEQLTAKHGFKIGVTHDPFENGQETPAAHGFVNAKGKYLFR